MQHCEAKKLNLYALALIKLMKPVCLNSPAVVLFLTFDLNVQVVFLHLLRGRRRERERSTEGKQVHLQTL